MITFNTYINMYVFIYYLFLHLLGNEPVNYLGRAMIEILDGIRLFTKIIYYSRNY